MSQRIDAPRGEVQAAFLEPEFYRALGRMPNIGPAELIDKDGRGDFVLLRVRYRFEGNLPAAATRVLDPGKLTWVDESTVHLRDYRTDFVMVPDHYPDRLQCRGRHHFVDNGDDSTQHVLEGDLTVRYPIVGRLVERAIIMGMRQHMTEEAKVVAAWVREG